MSKIVPKRWGLRTYRVHDTNGNKIFEIKAKRLPRKRIIKEALKRGLTDRIYIEWEYRGLGGLGTGFIWQPLPRSKR